MTDELVLPELHDGPLDLPTLRQLFFDVAHAARLLEVRVKRGALARADDGPVGLEDARALLESGDAMGVQVRYVHQGTEWLDTVLRLRGGFRLVRIANTPDERA